MHNQEVRGGLVSEADESRVWPADPAAVPLDVRGACADLLALAEEHNVLNAALMEAHRARHSQEQQARRGDSCVEGARRRRHARGVAFARSRNSSTRFAGATREGGRAPR